MISFDIIASSILGVSVGVCSYIIQQQLKSHSKIKTKKSGIAVFQKNGFVEILFVNATICKIECNLFNLPPGYHGIHVHEKGDLREGCKSSQGHYNPYFQNHGGPFGIQRHQGDFGNIFVQQDGTCNEIIYAETNSSSLIGRTLVIHEGFDDMGLSRNQESLKTGNAGHRMLCAVIGIK